MGRQTVMLSATMPDKVEFFAKTKLETFQLVSLDSEFEINPLVELHGFVLKADQKVPFLWLILE